MSDYVPFPLDAAAHHPLQLAMRECILRQMHGVPVDGDSRSTRYILGRFNAEELDTILAFVLSFDAGNLPQADAAADHEVNFQYYRIGHD